MKEWPQIKILLVYTLMVYDTCIRITSIKSNTEWETTLAWNRHNASVKIKQKHLARSLDN